MNMRSFNSPKPETRYAKNKKEKEKKLFGCKKYSFMLAKL